MYMLLTILPFIKTRILSKLETIHGYHGVFRSRVFAHTNAGLFKC